MAYAVTTNRTQELRAAAMGFRLLPAKAQQRVTKAMKTAYLPMLGKEVIANAALFGTGGQGDVRAAADQRFYGGMNPGIGIGTGKRQFSGGADSAELIRAYEFGSNRTLYTEYMAAPWGRGEKREIQRRATRQFRSQRKKGYFVYRTLAETMPTIAAAWVGIVADEIRAAMGAD